MNIIYVGAFRMPNCDAAAQRVLNVAKALKVAGHNVTFISWGGNYAPEYQTNDDEYRVDGFKYIVTGELDAIGGTAKRVMSRMTRGRKSLSILKKMSQVDLIISYNPSLRFNIRLLIYSATHNIKYADDLTEWSDKNELRFIERLTNYLNMNYAEKKVKNKILISSFLGNFYSNCNKIIIPPFCDPMDKKWSVNSVTSLDYFDGITLIYAGNPARKDCLHNAINAVQTLIDEGFLIRFLILGVSRDKYLSGYSSLLRTSDLSSGIVFLGRVPQDLVPSYYRQADFMVLLREMTRKSSAGFPTKFAESFVAGIPVIANLTSDIGCYLKDGYNGFVSKACSETELVALLKQRVLTLSRDEINEMKNNVITSSIPFDYRSHVTKLEVFLNHLR